MPVAQEDSGMWDKELRSAVGLSKKNGPHGDSFFWARGELVLWSSGSLHLLDATVPQTQG